MSTLQKNLQRLPDFFRERTRLHSGDADYSGLRQGGFVLYWMSTAMRTDENPALDVARQLAVSLELPWLIYQGLSSRYPFASDRHHAFILEAARDVQSQCQRQGLPYLFNLETDNPSSRTMLRDLAQRAALIVVEEMPTDPPRNFLVALSKKVDRPIVAVDTACVVPMQLVGKAYDRAFAFRDSTQKLRRQRVTADYPNVESNPKPLSTIDALAAADDWIVQCFKQGIDLQQCSLRELIARCDIDHSIPPVTHTQGGSTAGYQRWNNFRRGGLSKYASLRNNALVDGVSRMSPYLHYGMVSPLRLAREASAIPGEGAEKFLDELLIWRELAYSYCFYNPKHATLEAVPAWARESLHQHQSDERSAIYNWDQLAHAETDDMLWNAAQLSLLRCGELHNNLRMTWGKALLSWTQSAGSALDLLIDLNHRFALDGRDPSSYGGILWCLGQFDRPFSPEQSIMGCVRSRSTEEHARRLNVDDYQSKVLERCRRPGKVAIIGAGMCGLMAALTLSRQGFVVELFDKSRGPSGRISTRRTDHADFDHGAQYFTVRNPLFSRYVQAWNAAGWVQSWTSPIATFQNGQRGLDSNHQRWVGTPSMNSIGKQLATKLEALAVNLRYNTTIQTLGGSANQWFLEDTAGQTYGPFSDVVVTLPAPQSRSLISHNGDHWQELRLRLEHVQYDPCWAVMATFDEPWSVDWGGAFINSGALRWVARNHTKPNRAKQPETLVLHSSADFARGHFDCDPTEVIELLMRDLWPAVGESPRPVNNTLAHRWRYSIHQSTSPMGLLSDSSMTVHFCGDWSHGSRVEGAFLAGIDAAGAIMRRKTIGVDPEESMYSDLPLFG